MDIVSLARAGIMGPGEGATEFIPVSSTGHLILAGRFLRFEGPAASAFEMFIQLGALAAVVWLYRRRFAGLFSFRRSDGFAGPRGLLLLGLTTLPALVLGGAAYGLIKTRLFNAEAVAWGLAAGGMAILLVERFRPPEALSGIDGLGRREAVLIGLFQCFALWPGMSRSACTILGAMLLGIERKTAVEYSFLAAVPVIAAAASLDLYKSLPMLTWNDLPVFAAGFIFSALSAVLAVTFFTKLVSGCSLAPFGWYRLGLAVFVFFA